MNILFVDKRFPSFGGISVVTRTLANKFVGDGHNVYVASLMPLLYNGIEDLIPKNVSVFKLETPTWKLSNIKILHKIIRDNNIDVIINQWALHFEVAFMINQARKGTKAKLLCELHSVPDSTKMIIEQTDNVKFAANSFDRIYQNVKLSIYHFITKASINYVYRICDKYILLSNGYIPKLIQYANLKEFSKLHAIGNAISLPKQNFVYEKNRKKNKLLYVGRMDPYDKRVIRIIKAWERVYGEYPDWSLELVGDGPELISLKEYVKKNSIERVKFYGFTKDPTQHYREASILLLTSDLEGFGLVIIESMQFGCVPIVYGSYVAIYDILENGIDGFITSMPYETNKTVKYMKLLMDNDILRDNMAKAAIEKSKKFSLENIVEEWYKMF